MRCAFDLALTLRAMRPAFNRLMLNVNSALRIIDDTQTT